MGEEIEHGQFNEQDYTRFRSQLEQETRLLKGWFDENRFSSEHPVAGFELEAWLLDTDLSPAPLNETFLNNLQSSLASPELASFNYEVNSTPLQLNGHVFSSMHQELNHTWQLCRNTATEMNCETVMIGILPTLNNEDLNLANMSKMERYRALNREVIRQRRGKPLVFDISGESHLHVTHRDVMLEAAATSFQVHMQVPQAKAANIYNASIIVSGPMVAVSANSPFLFGKSLWAETRIPVFEQAVAIGGYDAAVFGPIKRVTFGSGYARESLMECFQENIEHYPVLLPVEFNDKPDKLHYLRLHNGTIWRWNRPLIGVDNQHPHLRIEHRVIPAGPTTIDTIANAAFYYGVVQTLSEQYYSLLSFMDFDKARDNFYAGARHGLSATMIWQNNKRIKLRDLCLNHLLPMAQDGLSQLGVADSDISKYLEVIEQRLINNTNGATWQRAYVKEHGNDMRTMLRAYMNRQQQGEPVHLWTV